MNIILYPISYNKRGESHLHSILGYDSENNLINIKLRPKRGVQNPPTVNDFSQLEHQSPHYCKAEKENRKDNRFGVLLFTNCYKDTSSRGGGKAENYIARWGTVLCHDENSPDFIEGIGRIDIPNGADESVNLEFMIANEKDPKKKQALINERKNNPRIRFFSIIYQHQKISRFKQDNVESIREYVKSTLPPITKMGATAGFAIRLLNETGKILRSSYTETYQKYVDSIQAYESIDETISTIMNSAHITKVKNSRKLSVELMPIIRLGAGHFTTKYYSRPKVYKAIRSYYTTTDYNQRVCRVVVKTAKLEQLETEALLFDSIYSHSESLGHPMRISSKGTVDLLIQGEDNNDQVDYMSHLSSGDIYVNRALTRNIQLLNYFNKIFISTNKEYLADNKDNLPTHQNDDKQPDELNNSVIKNNNILHDSHKNEGSSDESVSSITIETQPVNHDTVTLELNENDEAYTSVFTANPKLELLCDEDDKNINELAPIGANGIGEFPPEEGGTTKSISHKDGDSDSDGYNVTEAGINRQDSSDGVTEVGINKQDTSDIVTEASINKQDTSDIVTESNFDKVASCCVITKNNDENSDFCDDVTDADFLISQCDTGQSYESLEVESFIANDNDDTNSDNEHSAIIDINNSLTHSDNSRHIESPDKIALITTLTDSDSRTKSLAIDQEPDLSISEDNLPLNNEENDGHDDFMLEVDEIKSEDHDAIEDFLDKYGSKMEDNDEIPSNSFLLDFLREDNENELGKPKDKDEELVQDSHVHDYDEYESTSHYLFDSDYEHAVEEKKEESDDDSSSELTGLAAFLNVD